MTGRRLLVAAVGAGLVLAGVPALGAIDPGRGAGDAAEARAMELLEGAAQAGRRLTYTGTQYVATWRSGATSSALVELHHDPERGSVLLDPAPEQGADVPAAAGVTAVLDPRMLRRLKASYSLQVTGPGRCAGRDASVIEARRPGGELAGRFWVDRDTGMLLRRDVFGSDGRRVRSSAFMDLSVRDGSSAEPRVSVVARTGTERPAPAAVERLQRHGWHVPEQLPDGFRLFETRLSGEVLHLAYTDGLSTLSLFAQEGRLGTEPMGGFTPESVAGQPVLVRRAAPERVVWAGGGTVWTLVSDAPEEAVRAVVAALPHDPAPDGGIGARLSRGLARLGGMLNPF